MSYTIDTTSQSSSCDGVTDDFKTCICLNNLGTSLLEKGLFHEASVCFRTSIEGLEGISCFPIKGSMSTSSKYIENDGLRMMFDAAIKLSSCEVSQCFAQHTQEDTMKLSVNKIAGVQAVDPILVHSAPSNSVFPIIISDFDCNDMIREPQTALAIVLYNYSLATRCQSMYETSSHSSLEREIKLLKAADMMLTKQLKHYEGTRLEKMWLISSSAIVLERLCEASYQHCRCVGYCEHIDSSFPSRLNIIYNYIIKYKAMCPYGINEDFAAAAA
jgi:hypothetical protein